MSISKQQVSNFCRWFNKNKGYAPTPYLREAPTFNDFLHAMLAHYTINIDKCSQTFYEDNWYPMIKGWTNVVSSKPDFHFEREYKVL